MTENLISSPDADFTKAFSRPEKEIDDVSQNLFVDGHIDLPYFMMNKADGLLFSNLVNGPFTHELARKSGFRLFCIALYCEDRFNRKGSFRHFQDILNFTLKHVDQVTFINNTRGISELKEDYGRLGALLLLENADALVDDPSYIPQLKDQSIIIVGLTHAGKNRIADGNAVFHSDGITREGRKIIRLLDENKVLIDIAHLHPKCFWELLDLTESPCISSHSGIRELYDRPRNISLIQAKEIFERGGVVGITFNPEMLSPNNKTDIDQVFAHLDIIVQKFGSGVVGIGSDFYGFDLTTEGLEDITGVTGLIEILARHGYGKEDINKIMGLNWLRVYESLLP